jgi:hypothetical protein
MTDMNGDILPKVNHDPVNAPSHYTKHGPDYEPIKVITAWNLLDSFCLANVIKYIARARHKGNTIEDLKKARWYLDYEIKFLEDAAKLSPGYVKATPWPTTNEA